MRELRAEGRRHAAAKLKAYGGEAGYSAGGAAYKRGGKVHSDEKEDKALLHSELKPSAFKPHKADGGPISGAMSGMVLGRSRHGSKKPSHGKGKGTNVNVIVAPRPSAGAEPMPVPPVARPALPPRPIAPMGGAPVPPPMPSRPVGAAGPGVGPMKRGGKVAYANGGKVGGYHAGAGSGEGREEKIERYGKKARA